MSRLSDAKFPCKECNERHIACSDTCEKYKAAKQRYNNAKAAEAKQRITSDYIRHNAIRLTKGASRA